MPIRAKSIWHSHPGLTVDDGHRVAPTPIVGALSAVAVQRALRHDHPVAGQQIADLDHRQSVLDPLADPIVVGAQRFPRLTMSLGAVRTHRGHHRADQLVTELLDTAFTIQPCRHGSVHIAAGGLAVHSGPNSHRPQPEPDSHNRSTSRISITETSRYIQRTSHINRRELIRPSNRATPSATRGMVPLLANGWSHDRG
jgi:hypothetical protein